MTKCIMCNSEKIKKFDAKPAQFLLHRMFDDKVSQNEYLYHCKTCGMYWSSFRPTIEQATKYYNNFMCKDYLEEREKYEPGFTKMRNVYFSQMERNIKLRKNFMNKMLKKYINFSKINKVLDYGGSSGECISEYFSNAEKYVYDVDTVETVENVKKISKEELIPEGYDFVQCCHVLEHVSSPIEIINECLSYLKPNGYLYLEVPYENFFETFIKHKQIFSIHEHINYFRASAFYKLFNKKNFIINRCQELQQPGGFAQSKSVVCLIRKVKPSFLNLILNKMNIITNYIEDLQDGFVHKIKKCHILYLILKNQ